MIDADTFATLAAAIWVTLIVFCAAVIDELTLPSACVAHAFRLPLMSFFLHMSFVPENQLCIIFIFIRNLLVLRAAVCIRVLGCRPIGEALRFAKGSRGIRFWNSVVSKVTRHAFGGKEGRWNQSKGTSLH